MDILEIGKNYELIIWDFDGTIVNLHVDWKRLKKELVNIINLKRCKVGKNNVSLNELIYLGGKVISREDIFKIIENYELRASYSVNKGVLNMILTFYDSKIKQCIFSDNMYKTIQTILTKLQIFNIFDLIISKESVKKFKPDSEGLRKILRYYNNIDKSNILYIGDSSKDKIVANQEGLNFFEIKGVSKDE